MPIFIAVLLAYVVNPLISLLQDRARLPRPVSILIFLALLLVVVSGAAVWLLPILMEQIMGMVQLIQQFLQNPPPWILEVLKRPEMAGWSERLQQLGQALGGNLMPIVETFLAGSNQAISFLSGVVGGTTRFVMTLFLVSFYFFFFAWHFEAIHGLTRYFPRSRRNDILHILRLMDAAIANFFRDRLIIALIMCVMFAAGWWFVGVPYALVLGTLSGILSIIPYAAVIGLPLAMLLNFIDAATAAGPSGDAIAFWWLPVLIWPAGVYALVQFVEGWILTPVIQGHSIQMSAVTIVIVVFIGAALAGIAGMILAIPAAACIKILFTEIFLPRLRRWAENR